MGARVTTFGSSLIDIVLQAQAGTVIPNKSPTLESYLGFERSAKISCDTMLFTFGGGGSNTAATFAHLGIATQIVTAIGDDALGAECVSNYQKLKIGRTFVQHIGSQRTGVSVVVNVRTGNDHVIFVHRGASAQVRLTSASLRRVTSEWFYVNAISGAWQKKIGSIFERAKRVGARVMWNPGFEQIQAGFRALKSYWRAADCVMVNLDEAAELLVSSGMRVAKPNARSLARRLTELGGAPTIVTNGRAGAIYCDGEHALRQPAIIGKTVSKTGAGDAFGSGFVAGMIMYNNVARALRLAAHNSHGVVGAIGAQEGLLSRRDLSRLKI